jgi:NAD(P)H-dependent FMN reductase
MVILGLCGSLREQSSNRTLLEAGQLCADGICDFSLYTQVAELPHFNPDLDFTHFDAVVRLVDQVRAADAIVVSSPEYARGIPGAFKNALDWLVGTDAFVEKPYALWSASTRSMHADECLRGVLNTMSGLEVVDASVVLPLLGTTTKAVQLAVDADQREVLERALYEIVAFVDRLLQPT